MNKPNKNIIFSSSKKASKDIICSNLSPKMNDPAFQINNTLKKYVDKKLNENTNLIDKELFLKKNKKLKEFNGIIKRNKTNTKNNKYNKYLTNSDSKENLQIFSSLQNISISIIHSNHKNDNNNEESRIYKNMTSKKTDNDSRILSYRKINNKNNYIGKTSSKLKFNLSGKISPLRVKRIFNMDNNYYSMNNLIDDNIQKCNLNEKSFSKTLYRFNSGDFNKEKIVYNNNNLIGKNCINNLALSHRIYHNQINKNTITVNKDKKAKKQINNKEIKNNNLIKNKNNIKNNVKNNNIKKLSKNNTKNLSKYNTSNKKVKIRAKIKNNDKKTKVFSNEIKTNNINNKKGNTNGEINKENNLNCSPKLEKAKKKQSKNNSSVLNIHVNDKKSPDSYELCWNLKNDYSKDIDISFISINNQKIKNYKLNTNNYSSIFKDNNNNGINNIYLNNIQNVNNINHKQDNTNNNKAEYYSKLELLKNENEILKNEIKESKNRIFILENKIEELLDDKNCKENSECPQPTPYVYKYSKDILFSKIKPKIEEQITTKKSNDNIKEYSKNETKESEISNRIINKNEE
jgi:hypothetical protein